MSQIRLLITDFDGTLVDTFESNFLAYREAFSKYGLNLSKKQYSDCFGLRFDDFMERMKIDEEDKKAGIRRFKSRVYPMFFDKLKINKSLIMLLQSFKQSGGMTAVASTARKENLMNVLIHLGIADIFSLILSGEDVKEGKPHPEIYLKVMKELGVSPEESLVFEDSCVGIESAKSAGINHILVNKEYFE